MTQYFDIRSRRQENVNLRVELFKFAKDENGRMYGTFADSKNTKSKKSPPKPQREDDNS